MACEWRDAKIMDVAEVNTTTYSTSEKWEYVNYLDTSNITSGHISEIQLISDTNTLPSRARRKVRAGDIVYSTVRPNQRHYGIIKNPSDNMLVSTGFAVLRGKSQISDTKFLYYFLIQDHVINQLQTIAEHSTSTYPSIRPGDIESLGLKLPALTEQQAIACILGALDDKIELNRRMNKTLEEMARAIFKSWFVDFEPVRAKAAGQTPQGLTPEIAALFPDSFEDSELGQIPKGWNISNIGKHFRLTMGQSPPGDTYNESGEGLPFYQGKTDFGFRFPARRVYCTAPTRLADCGDTLVSVRAPVGDVNMAKDKCAVGRGVASICHKKGYKSLTYYVMRQLKNYFDQFEAEGTVFGSINRADFERLPFIESPIDVLRNFDQIVSPIDHRIEKNECQIRTLATIRDTLLPKLISGELQVRDAEKFLQRVNIEGN